MSDGNHDKLDLHVERFAVIVEIPGLGVVNLSDPQIAERFSGVEEVIRKIGATLDAAANGEPFPLSTQEFGDKLVANRIETQQLRSALATKERELAQLRVKHSTVFVYVKKMHRLVIFTTNSNCRAAMDAVEAIVSRSHTVIWSHDKFSGSASCSLGTFNAPSLLQQIADAYGLKDQTATLSV